MMVLSPEPQLVSLLEHWAHPGVRARSYKTSALAASAAWTRASSVVQSYTPAAVLICDQPVSVSHKRCEPTGTFGHGVLAQLMCMPKNVAEIPAASAVPESGRFNVGFEALLVNATFPFTLPAACGVNTRLKDALCPAARVRGIVS